MYKILVIDDYYEIRDNIAEILTLAGYEVLTAQNGKKGLELAFSELPDLVICDMMMPEIDGYGVLDQLKASERTRGIQFIFLSAMTERCDMMKGKERGADDYITKPFEEVDLLNAVEYRLKAKNGDYLPNHPR